MQAPYLINGHHDRLITPLDRGFAYGDGVFRTLVVRNRVPDAWARQYEKLRSDCLALNIACPSPELLREDIERLCGLGEIAIIKMVVTRGDGARGYRVPADIQSNRVLIKSPMMDYPEQYYQYGVRLHQCQLRLGSQPRLAGIKHLNRLENVLARMEWDDTDFFEGLLLDEDGRAIECTTSNIFIRRDNELITPDLSRCGVAGVTRERILEFAPDLQLSPVVADISLETLKAADEVVICNSLYGAWQVRQLEDRQWASCDLACRIRERLNK